MQRHDDRERTAKRDNATPSDFCSPEGALPQPIPTYSSCPNSPFSHGNRSGSDFPNSALEPETHGSSNAQILVLRQVFCWPSDVQCMASAEFSLLHYLTCSLFSRGVSLEMGSSAQLVNSDFHMTWRGCTGREAD